jgi:hypothetical protein
VNGCGGKFLYESRSKPDETEYTDNGHNLTFLVLLILPEQRSEHPQMRTGGLERHLGMSYSSYELTPFDQNVTL